MAISDSVQQYLKNAKLFDPETEIVLIKSVAGFNTLKYNIPGTRCFLYLCEIKYGSGVMARVSLPLPEKIINSEQLNKNITLRLYFNRLILQLIGNKKKVKGATTLPGGANIPDTEYDETHDDSELTRNDSRDNLTQDSTPDLSYISFLRFVTRNLELITKRCQISKTYYVGAIRDADRRDIQYKNTIILILNLQRKKARFKDNKETQKLEQDNKDPKVKILPITTNVDKYRKLPLTISQMIDLCIKTFIVIIHLKKLKQKKDEKNKIPEYFKLELSEDSVLFYNINNLSIKTIQISSNKIILGKIIIHENINTKSLILALTNDNIDTAKLIYTTILNENPRAFKLFKPDSGKNYNTTYAIMRGNNRNNINQLIGRFDILINTY